MKLTKTEQKILDHMTKRHGRYGATKSHGRGAHGGNIFNEGAQEFNACRKLVARGLVEQVGDIYHHTVYHNSSGYSVRCAEIVIKFKE